MNEDKRIVFEARTPARRHALALAHRVASKRCPVLIMGPTGVGKEVLAEEIHRHCERATKRFVAINCAAVSSSLFESTFFGHMRGSFTGATSDKPGIVELADGWTLFLDEVGELSVDNQAKLLRFLAQGTYWPVGGTTERCADVRIVSATHRDIIARVIRPTVEEPIRERWTLVQAEVLRLLERDHAWQGAFRQHRPL